jgi:DNA mismatch repair protein MutS2
MDKANKKLPPKQEEPIKRDVAFKVGDAVKYHSQRGVILSMRDERDATIEVDGMRVRVKTKYLRHSTILKTKPRTDVSVQVDKKAGLKCDLHGMRADEACDELDVFLSNALINGWDEVIVYHGIGTGKLSYAVKNFLAAHPSVKKFEDAPQHMGGFGAKLVSL